MNFSLKDRKKTNPMNFSLKNLYFRPLTPDVNGSSSWRPRRKHDSRKLTLTFSYKDFNEYMKRDKSRTSDDIQDTWTKPQPRTRKLSRLQHPFSHSHELPNLLFYGPPGTGKTSTILAASRELFGDMYKTRVLELNSSDERGIDVIRQKVKTFAQLTASGTRPDGRPCPPFKIVILDEADSMTRPAQAALRRTMEKQSKTTRFCLICNYVSRIIEPITSRCAKFRFKPLSEDILSKRLREICEKEAIKCDEEGIKGLMYTSEGDLRKAITFLQSAARLKGDSEITKQDIYEIAGVIHDEVIDKLIEVCSTDSYETLEQEVKSAMMEGHSGMQVITQLHDKLVEMETLTDKQKSIILEKLAVVDKCLIDGADEYLQLMSLFTTIMQQICHGEK